jgi:Na+-transporting NADH:ubiquinone oxidoreductase subunit NqrD
VLACDAIVTTITIAFSCYSWLQNLGICSAVAATPQVTASTTLLLVVRNEKQVSEFGVASKGATVM